MTLSYQRCQSCISCVRACVSTLWDVGLTSDQAVMGWLFLSSTILLLKFVMNFFLQPFPFLLIERRTVVSYWQNPTPGSFVSIRWEHLGIISLPSPPIKWAIILMRTQLSNNMVSSHKPKKFLWGFSIPMVQCSSRHLPFTFSKKCIGPILVKLHIKHYQVWKGKDARGFLADWIGTLAYIDV